VPKHHTKEALKLHPSETSALDRDEWLASRSGRLTKDERDCGNLLVPVISKSKFEAGEFGFLIWFRRTMQAVL